jgi:uncharacterized membrane protein YqjE
MNGNGVRGVGELLRDLARDGADLVRAEVRLARVELEDVARGVGRGSATVALGVVLLALGALAVATGLVLLAGDQWLPRDRYWLGALVVGLAMAAASVLLAKRGLAVMSPAELAPQETVETIKEDVEWLKHQLTSGATSR